MSNFFLYNFFCRFDLLCFHGSFSISENNFSKLLTLVNTNRKTKNVNFAENFGKKITFLAHPTNATKALNSILYVPSKSFSGSDSIDLTVTSLIPSKERNIISHQITGKTEKIEKIEKIDYNDGISVNSVISIFVESSEYLKFICLPKIEILEEDSFNLGEIKHCNFYQ